jgi:hypothetical protein
VALEFWTAAEVDQYLARRFPAHALPSELACVLHRSTEGNPLFLVDTVDDLIDQGRLRELEGRWELVGPVDEVAARAPKTLWQLVETQVDRLTADEQEVLVAASVAGVEFSAALTAAAGIDTSHAELRCAALARRGQFLRAVGEAEWPDGTVAERYAFIHALYQQVLYARVSVGARAGLHLRAGERLERGYGARGGEIAAELAVHFERGRDMTRAGGRAGPPPSRLSRSGRACRTGARRPRRAITLAGRRRARAPSSNHPRRGPHRDQGLCRARCRESVCAGVGALREGREPARRGAGPARGRSVLSAPR